MLVGLIRRSINSTYLLARRAFFPGKIPRNHTGHCTTHQTLSAINGGPMGSYQPMLSLISAPGPGISLYTTALSPYGPRLPQILPVPRLGVNTLHQDRISPYGPTTQRLHGVNPLHGRNVILQPRPLGPQCRLDGLARYPPGPATTV